jgi:hypothetical protein
VPNENKKPGANKMIQQKEIRNMFNQMCSPMISVIIWGEKDGKQDYSVMYVGKRAVKPNERFIMVMLNGAWRDYYTSCGISLAEAGGKVPRGFVKTVKGEKLYTEMNAPRY